MELLLLLLSGPDVAAASVVAGQLLQLPPELL
jgi:hypothetical protein